MRAFWLVSFAWLLSCASPVFLVVSLSSPAQTTAPEIDTLEVTVSAEVDGEPTQKVVTFEVVNQSLPVSFFLEFEGERRGLTVALSLSGQLGGVEVLRAVGSGQVGQEASLTAEFCGDLVLQTGAGEECDDGNRENGDTCVFDCSLPFCGNAVVDAGEGCDDGNGVNTDACTNTCQPALCGDNIIQSGVEQCDDGVLNANTADACRLTCELPRCGDGLLDTLEACDDFNTLDADGCEGDCSLPACGNGIFDPGELCFAAPQVLAVGNTPVLLKSADVNGDGVLDLASLNKNAATISLLIGNPDGSFQPQRTVPVLANATDFDFGRFNPDDALPDLVVVNNSRTVRVMFGVGDATFFPSVDLSVNSTEFAGSVVATDIDRNNLDDVVVSGMVGAVFGATVSVLINKTTSTQNILFDPPDVFSQQLGQVVGLVDGDFTGDLSNDIALAILSGGAGNTVGQLRFFENANNPVTTFVPPVILPDTGMGAEIDTPVAADVDGDGALDLLTLNSTSARDIALFMGQGDGQFDPIQRILVSNTLIPSALAVSDITADLLPDLVVTLSGVGGQFIVLPGQGGGVFGSPVSFSVSATPTAIVTGDFNQDGFQDVAITQEAAADFVSVFLFNP